MCCGGVLPCHQTASANVCFSPNIRLNSGHSRRSELCQKQTFGPCRPLMRLPFSVGSSSLSQRYSGHTMCLERSRSASRRAREGTTLAAPPPIAAITRRTERSPRNRHSKGLCIQERTAHRNHVRSCHRLSAGAIVQSCKNNVSFSTSFQVAEMH